MSKRLRDAIRAIEKGVNVNVIKVESGRRAHFKLHTDAGFFITISASASDCRALKNAISDARRMKRQMETG